MPLNVTVTCEIVVFATNNFKDFFQGHNTLAPEMR